MTTYADALPREDHRRGIEAIRQRSPARPRVSTRESLRFLTDLGNTLAASLDYQTTLQRVVELMVPRLACYCELGMIEDGQLRRMGFAHRDRALHATLGQREILSSLPCSAGPLATLLASGRPLLIEKDDEAPRAGAEPAAAPPDLFRLTGATSLILVTLAARSRVSGVLLLASTRVDRKYDRRDLALAEEVARIAALAIDNARLYSEANRAIRAREEVLRVVSHDLRNPIGAMGSAASVVLESAREEGVHESTGRLLETIVRGASQASGLIDDLLDLARIDAGTLVVNPEPQPLTPIVFEALELHTPMARQREIRLRCAVPGRSPIVNVDRGRLLQLLGNLLSNAIRFTPPEGEIAVTVGCDGGEVRCSVADTGPGIRPEQLPHIFDRFWQASRGGRAGLGLGLSIVRAIAEGHGGQVRVRSEPGGGAEFVFTLPLAGMADRAEVDDA